MTSEDKKDLKLIGWVMLGAAIWCGIILLLNNLGSKPVSGADVPFEVPSWVSSISNL